MTLPTGEKLYMTYNIWKKTKGCEWINRDEQFGSRQMLFTKNGSKEKHSFVAVKDKLAHYSSGLELEIIVYSEAVDHDYCWELYLSAVKQIIQVSEIFAYGTFISVKIQSFLKCDAEHHSLLLQIVLPFWEQIESFNVLKNRCPRTYYDTKSRQMYGRR